MSNNKTAAYYGVSNGKWAERIGANTYSEDLLPVKFLKSVSETPNSNTQEQYADNRLILQAVSETGYTGAIGTTGPDTDFEIALGMKQRLADGMLADVNLTQAKHGAFYYETIFAFEDAPQVVAKVWLLNVQLRRPSEGKQTNNPSPNFGDYSYDYTAVGETILAEDGAKPYLDAQGFEHTAFRVISLPGDTGYETFGESVPTVKMPAAASGTSE